MTDPSGDSLVPALMAAQSVALSARTGQLTLHQVDDARTRAEELLPRDHPVRAAILTFATMYEQDRRDAHQIRKQGEYLQDALGRALNPDAPVRRIYGRDDD